MLAHAVAACDDAACVPVGCAPNFFDVDRLAANGCECEKKTEECNNLDDDCDGVPDWFVDTNGLPRSACKCEPVPVAPLKGRPDGDGGMALCTKPQPVQCTVDPQGALVMDMCVADRTTQPMWAQCIFESVSLEAFDADWGADGMLEIIYQTSAPLAGLVDIYYGGPPMSWPRRKMLSLSGSTSLPAGMHRALLRPASAVCPLYQTTPVSCLPPDYITPIDCIPDACRNGCTAGRWSDQAPQCTFSYAGVPLWLTFESIPDSTPSQQARITVSSITHFPSTCACARNADCRDGVHTFCDLTVVNAGQGVCKAP